MIISLFTLFWDTLYFVSFYAITNVVFHTFTYLSSHWLVSHFVFLNLFIIHQEPLLTHFCCLFSDDLILIVLRSACSVQEDENDAILVIGGNFTEKTVSRYNRNGWVEDLPSINDGRRSHSCSNFVRNSERVWNMQYMLYFWISSIF